MAKALAYKEITVEEVESFLEFTEGYDYGLCETLANRCLEEHTLEEILLANEMTEEEAVAVLFYSGEIGLPTEIVEEITNETVQDLQDQEDDIGW